MTSEDGNTVTLQFTVQIAVRKDKIWTLFSNIPCLELLLITIYKS